MDQYPLQYLNDSILHSKIQLQLKSPAGGQGDQRPLPLLPFLSVGNTGKYLEARTHYMESEGDSDVAFIDNLLNSVCPDLSRSTDRHAYYAPRSVGMYQ